MSTATGNALKMRLQLRSLMQRHRVQNQPVSLPLFAPAETDMMMEGYCSTDDVDGDRCKFRPYCFGFPLRREYRNVPLLFKHFADQVAGKIEDLEYDNFGSLCVWATVTYPMAKRMGAFSIGAIVNSYEIIDADSPDNFHALITQAELTEVSLTSEPANPNCLVMDRNRVSPAVQVLSLLAEKMKRLHQIAGLLQKGISP